MSKTKQRRMARGGKGTSANRKLGAIRDSVTGGIDRVAQEIQTLYHNEIMMSDALDNMDIMIVVLRSILVQKGIVTNEEFDAEIEKMKAIKLKMVEDMRKAKEAPVETPAETPVLGPDPELVRMKEAAEEAGKEGTPKDAFIFGG